jgi:hypothetical protein
MLAAPLSDPRQRLARPPLHASARLHDPPIRGTRSRGFAAFVNSNIAQGRDVLTRGIAFWINILGVWVLFVVSFYLAKYVAIGFAFAPVYATLINALTHALEGLC